MAFSRFDLQYARAIPEAKDGRAGAGMGGSHGTLTSLQASWARSLRRNPELIELALKAVRRIQRVDEAAIGAAVGDEAAVPERGDVDGIGCGIDVEDAHGRTGPDEVRRRHVARATPDGPAGTAWQRPPGARGEQGVVCRRFRHGFRIASRRPNAEKPGPAAMRGRRAG